MKRKANVGIVYDMLDTVDLIMHPPYNNKNNELFKWLYWGRFNKLNNMREVEDLLHNQTSLYQTYPNYAGSSRTGRI